MKFSPKCRTKRLGIINTILKFLLIFDLGREGADIGPLIRLWKIPEHEKRSS